MEKLFRCYQFGKIFDFCYDDIASIHIMLTFVFLINLMDDDLFVNFPDENTLLAEAAKHQLGEVYLHPDYNTKSDVF